MFFRIESPLSLDVDASRPDVARTKPRFLSHLRIINVSVHRRQSRVERFPQTRGEEGRGRQAWDLV
ncbi:MAG: hypothetical protein L0Z07_07105 [Planctomycetes bacterium]|nr:hypothetical protein [Planctomycetota bacterium]